MLTILDRSGWYMQQGGKPTTENPGRRMRDTMIRSIVFIAVTVPTRAFVVPCLRPMVTGSMCEVSLSHMNQGRSTDFRDHVSH